MNTMKPMSATPLAQKLPLLKLGIVLLQFLLLAAGPADATQVLDRSTGKSLVGRISLTDPSRIAVEGARIRRVLKISGEFEQASDEVTGAVFLTPASEKPISVFVLDDKNRTFKILLQPDAIPAEDLLIRDGEESRGTASAIEKSGERERAGKNLILALENDTVPPGMELREGTGEIPLWNESRFRLERRLVGRWLIGEKYELTNTSGKPMTLDEREFFRKGVVAIAIDYFNLNPGESTYVLVVRERRPNE